MPKRAVPFDANGPLRGRRILVVGAGPIGLFIAIALRANGADVTVRSAMPISEGTGFLHAAGLIEPVATSDPRAAEWFAKSIQFCAKAADDPAWGVTPRDVLLMSDFEHAVHPDWINAVRSRNASDADLADRRAFGQWFSTYVLQPNIGIKAIVRELRTMGVLHPDPHRTGTIIPPVSSVKQAAEMATGERMDAFVLAPGLNLAALDDIEAVTGSVGAGISAGLGLTIRIPLQRIELDHVVMDADDFGYLIPQRNQVICGGTNVLVPHDDDLVDGESEISQAIRQCWESDVRDRVGHLHPALSGFTDGEVRVGARPLRREVLTQRVDGYGLPGILVGGAGGSGWTFNIGIADDTCKFLAHEFGNAEPRELCLE